MRAPVVLHLAVCWLGGPRPPPPPSPPPTGYARIVLAVVAFANYWAYVRFTGFYLVGFLLDAADGYAARRLNQRTCFGECASALCRLLSLPFCSLPRFLPGSCLLWFWYEGLLRWVSSPARATAAYSRWLAPRQGTDRLSIPSYFSPSSPPCPSHIPAVVWVSTLAAAAVVLSPSPPPPQIATLGPLSTCSPTVCARAPC